MAKMKWTLRCRDGVHNIELDHSKITGKRKIILDGEVVYQEKSNLYYFGSRHRIYVDGHESMISITTNGLGYNYSLAIGGKKYEPGQVVRVPDQVVFDALDGEHIPMHEDIPLHIWIKGRERPVGAFFILVGCVLGWMSIISPILDALNHEPYVYTWFEGTLYTLLMLGIGVFLIWGPNVSEYFDPEPSTRNIIILIVGVLFIMAVCGLIPELILAFLGYDTLF